jgi:hypothetical protein
MMVALLLTGCGAGADPYEDDVVDAPARADGVPTKKGQNSQNVLPVSCSGGCYGAQHECVTAAQDTPSLGLAGECVLICGPYTASACYAAGGWCPYLADGSQVCAVYP